MLDALGHEYVNLDTAIDGHTDHVDRKVICSRCQDLKSENEKYHLEWVDGNYTTETIVAGKMCIRDSCNALCNCCLGLICSKNQLHILATFHKEN